MQHNELKDACTRLSRFVVGTEGNVSKRLPDGFLIKSSGRSFLDPSFVCCNFDGSPRLTDGQNKPSMEASFHAFIYNNSDYKFIVHTHPINLLKILCSNLVYQFANSRLFPDQVVFNSSRSCIVPYATPGESLTRAIAKAMQSYVVFPEILLLQNHGIICCSGSLERAIVMTEICEKSAEIFLGIDFPRFLTDQEVEDIQQHKDETYRRNLI